MVGGRKIPHLQIKLRSLCSIALSWKIQRIDELLSQYGKESEGNAKTIVRVHQRVDQIQTSYKTLKGVGMFIVASLTAVGAWFGLIDTK